MLEDPVPLEEVRRALVIKLRHHGDVLLATPVLSALKAHAPACEIDALVYADTAVMLAEHPALHAVHVIDRQWKSRGAIPQLAAEWRLLKALRDRRYDFIVHLTEHRRGAWLTRLLRPRWSVAPKKGGRGRFWRNSFTHLYAQPGHALRHTVEKNLDALRRIGLQPGPEQRKPAMVPGTAAQQRITDWMQAHGVRTGGFVHLHPGSRWLFKCWPSDKVAALIDGLHEAGQVIVLTAAPDPKEAALIDAVRAATRAPVHDLSGQLNLRELAALAMRAQLFVGVDSAPMHIAAAMGTPVVALFGPSGEREWGPWQVIHSVVTSDHPCRPCGLDGCGGGKVSDCLTTLPVARVLAACNELLR